LLPRWLQFYIKGGWLLPKYHEVYWIGLSTQADPPNFGWTSGAFKAKQNHCGWLEHLLAVHGLHNAPHCPHHA
jgi:hypothetical protein